MLYNIIYLEKASMDLESILDFIALDSPQRAWNYLQFLQESIAKLADFPKLGVECKRKNIRRNCRILIIEEYLVFYQIDELSTTLIIGRVLHRSINHNSRNFFQAPFF
jgi:toxin ParE1/3/4